MVSYSVRSRVSLSSKSITEGWGESQQICFSISVYLFPLWVMLLKFFEQVFWVWEAMWWRSMLPWHRICSRFRSTWYKRTFTLRRVSKYTAYSLKTYVICLIRGMKTLTVLCFCTGSDVLCLTLNSLGIQTCGENDNTNWRSQDCSPSKVQTEVYPFGWYEKPGISEFHVTILINWEFPLCDLLK